MKSARIIEKEALLTHKRLLELLSYDKKSGVFTWKIAPNGRISVGQQAGSINTNHAYPVPTHKR